MWIIAGLYLVITGLFIQNFSKLPFKYQVYLAKKYKNIKIMDILHYILLFVVMSTNFLVYWSRLYGLIKENTEKTKNWSFGAIEWRTAMFSTAHWADLCLAFTLIPVSRRSFLPKIFRLSPSSAIKYHQLMANLLVISSVLHGIVSYGIFEFLSNEFDFKKDILLIGKKITYKAFNVPFGIFLILLVIVVKCTSFESIRRKQYQIFLYFHHRLMVPIVLLAAAHAASNLYWTIPSLALYLIDCIYSYLNLHYEYNARAFMANGLIQLEIFGSFNCCPGQYYLLRIKELSNTPHPFSVAYNSDYLGFLIKPTVDRHTWTARLEKLVKEGYYEQINLLVSLDGPFGVRPFDLSITDIVVFFVGGSGISAALPLIEECTNHHRNCYLFWSVRNAALIELDYFKRIEENEINIKIYETEDPFRDNHFVGEEEMHLIVGSKVTRGRMQVQFLIDQLVNEFSSRNIAIYTCGPQSLMDSVEESASIYSNVMVVRESFEW